MPRQFIKVTKDYSTKNRVQELCLNSLKELDRTLYPNLSEAKKLIKQKFNFAINSYSGRAMIPELKEFEPNKNITTFYIEDVIYLEIYKVSIDFTN